MDEDDEHRVRVVVHNIRPPFLKGVKLSKQIEAVIPLRDSTSDMAVMARKGSNVVQWWREERDKAEKPKVGELAGTAMGRAIGVKAADAVSAARIQTIGT